MNGEDDYGYADDFADDDESDSPHDGDRDSIKAALHEQQVAAPNDDAAALEEDRSLLTDRIQSLEKILNEERSASDRLRRQLVSRNGGEGRTPPEEALLLSERLVAEGEKNVKLALELDRIKDELGQMKKQTEKFRQTLLNGINGGMADSQRYNNISLGDLLRIRLQERAPSDGDQNDTSDRSVTSSSVPPTEQSSKLHHEIAALKESNRILQNKCSELDKELKSSKDHQKALYEVKHKLSRVVERSRQERSMKGKAENELTLANRKVEALSEHIEKLMLHLKHEAASKARAVIEYGRASRELELHKKQNDILVKKNDRKDRVLVELQEAGKILQDQLRLMDDKYLDLRVKLDWTRLQTERVLKKKDDEVREMRSKFVLASQLSDHKAPPPLLDKFDPGRHQKESSKVANSQSKKTISPIGATIRNPVKQSALAKSVRFREEILQKDMQNSL